MSVDVVEVHIGGGHYTWTCPKSCIFQVIYSVSMVQRCIVCVYYYSTYYKAVRGGGEEESGEHVL